MPGRWDWVHRLPYTSVIYLAYQSTIINYYTDEHERIVLLKQNVEDGVWVSGVWSSVHQVGWGE